MGKLDVSQKRVNVKAGAAANNRHFSISYDISYGFRGVADKKSRGVLAAGEGDIDDVVRDIAHLSLGDFACPNVESSIHLP